jgi:hypothetical protein
MEMVIFGNHLIREQIGPISHQEKIQIISRFRAFVAAQMDNIYMEHVILDSHFIQAIME